MWPRLDIGVPAVQSLELEGFFFLLWPFSVTCYFIGVASISRLGGPHIVKDEMQVEHHLSMLNWGVLP